MQKHELGYVRVETRKRDIEISRAIAQAIRRGQYTQAEWVRELVEFCMLPLFDIAAVRHESSCGLRYHSGLMECVEPFVVSL